MPEACVQVDLEESRETAPVSLETPSPPEAPPAAETRRAAREAEPGQASLLVMLAEEEAELFHTPAGEACATLFLQDRRETWPVRSKEFRQWLARRFYRGGGQVARGASLSDALTVVEGLALDECPEHPVYLRKAEHAGALYLDLANDDWEVVKITPEGWKICSEAPVRFRRAEGMLPLPTPIRGRTIDALRPFVNVAGESDFKLLVMWLLAALGPCRPYPFLGLHGDPGSGKRATARVLQGLVDPCRAEPAADPRRPRDLACLAANHLLVVLENLRAMPDGLADALSRLATGGVSTSPPGFGDEEGGASGSLRPVLWTAAGEFAPAAVHVDRLLTLRLPPISEERAGPTPNSGRPSAPPGRESWGRCWTAWRPGCAICRRPARSACRASPTSSAGPARPSAAWAGPPARSGPPTRKTGARPPARRWPPIPWRSRSWRS